jgi:hypothetical protein
MQPRILYVERKTSLAGGRASIGRVSYSQTGRTLYYQGKALQSQKGSGFKSNHFDVATGEEYWVSGPRRDGRDRMDYDHAVVTIDEDVREEYWTTIRRAPERVERRVT